MSKVLTFSRTFPAYHPKKGHETDFIEKIWKSLGFSIYDADTIYPGLKSDRFDINKFNSRESCHEIRRIIERAAHVMPSVEPKYHTVREGYRFEEGEWFSPRVWSDKPYASKQIIIAPDIQVEQTWKFEIKKMADGFWIDFGSYHVPPDFEEDQTIIRMLAKNDGLTVPNFLNWFKYPNKPFKGQIICWNDTIKY